MSAALVRRAAPGDVPALTTIRSHYVLHTQHGFREVGSSVGYARKWDRDISSTWFQRSAPAVDDEA